MALHYLLVNFCVVTSRYDNRHQRVKISDAKHWTFKKVFHRGQYLAPFCLHLIYILFISLFISYAHKDIEIIKSVLERDIKNMLEWFKNNSLQANPSKFQRMLLKNKTVNAEDFNNIVDKQRVLMHGHQGWNVRHGLCHIYMIYVYIWVVYSFCLFCCLFIIVTTQFVALYKPCKPKPN